MSRFIESIRIANGKIENLSLHQERVDRTLNAHNTSPGIQLEEHITTDVLSDQEVYKCRVLYDLENILDIQYLPYRKRAISSLGIVRDNSIAYSCKFANRNHINLLLSRSNTDEIIIVRNGLVTDASYTNLAFFDGKDWYTSNTPLLRGVQREKLIRNNTIKEMVIEEKDIPDFLSIRLINAMIPWEEAIEVPVSAVVPSSR